MTDVWSRALDDLRGNTSPAIFDSWIAPIAWLGSSDGTVHLGVPDARLLDYVATHHAERIRAAVSAAAGSYVRLQFEILDDLAGEEPAVAGRHRPAAATPPLHASHAGGPQGDRRGRSTGRSPQQARDRGHAPGGAGGAPAGLQAQLGEFDPSAQQPLPWGRRATDRLSAPPAGRTTRPVRTTGPGQFSLDFPPASADAVMLDPGDGLVDALTFDRLVIGRANELAVGAARAVAEANTAIFNPLFLQGGVGNGKTHLLHAIGNQVKLLRPQTRVLYVPASTFVDDAVSAMRSGTNNARAAVRDLYRSADLLLVDDVQFLQGKDRTQEEFFHTFNYLHQYGKQIILTSDRSPAALEQFQDRLRSRFVWGLVAEITPPDEAMRLQIVMQKAEQRGLLLSHGVAMLVAERVRGSVRELEGVLNKLEAFSKIGGRPLDRDLVRQILGPLGTTGGLADLDAILRATAQHYGVRVPDLKGDRRQRQVTVARMVATYLARKHLQLSYPELGRAFGGRDHSTAHNACKRVQDWLAEDERVAEAVAAIEAVVAPNGR